jgi:hypothetical protein
MEERNQTTENIYDSTVKNAMNHILCVANATITDTVGKNAYITHIHHSLNNTFFIRIIIVTTTINNCL